MVPKNAWPIIGRYSRQAQLRQRQYALKPECRASPAPDGSAPGAYHRHPDYDTGPGPKSLTVFGFHRRRDDPSVLRADAL